MDVHHEVATGGVFHDEAHVRTGLEAGKHVDKERVPHRIGHLEDSLLGKQGLHLVSGDDVAFLQGLDGEVFPSVQVFGQDDLAEVAATKDGAELEVLQAHVGVRSAGLRLLEAGSTRERLRPSTRSSRMGSRHNRRGMSACRLIWRERDHWLRGGIRHTNDGGMPLLADLVHGLRNLDLGCVSNLRLLVLVLLLELMMMRVGLGVERRARRGGVVVVRHVIHLHCTVVVQHGAGRNIGSVVVVSEANVVVVATAAIVVASDRHGCGRRSWSWLWDNDGCCTGTSGRRCGVVVNISTLILSKNKN